MLFMAYELFLHVLSLIVLFIYVVQVLTMEWVDGARLNDKAAIEAMGLDSSKFVDTLVQCSLR